MFLQPVQVPERCFLEEVLLWVTFQRLPVAAYDFHGIELRDGDKEGGYMPEGMYYEEPLDDEECARAGIPPNPTYTQAMNDKCSLPLEHYDQYLEMTDIHAAFREQLERDRQEAVAYFQALDEWTPKYEAAIEYPASRIFVALREGRVWASGRLLPDVDLETALTALHDEGKDIIDLPVVEIPSTFWSLSGIDWSSNAAQNGREHYCWVRCNTGQVLALFPGDNRQPVSGVERIGSTFFVDDEAPAIRRSLSRRPRGRPPFPWELFHLEVADLLRRGELPQKKEAAIQHLQDWFGRAIEKAPPSRAAIGEKLKPYYDRFIRPAQQK